MVSEIYFLSPGLVSAVQCDSEDVLSWIPVPNDEHPQEQGSRAKHSQVTCTSEAALQFSIYQQHFYLL